MPRVRRDIVDIDGLRLPPDDDPADGDEGDARGPSRRFLMIWFRCCHAYGRLYRNPQATMYEGRCPSCGASVHAIIGADGTSKRMFEAT